MGKKNYCPRVKKPPPSPPPALPPPPSPIVDSASEQATLAVESPDYEGNKEGLRAISTFKSGDHKKALKVIRESISRRPDSAYLHSTEAAIHLGLAAKGGKGSYKELKHLTEASRSAELAMKLFPKSLEYAYSLALLLHALTRISAKEWDDKLIEVCECALKIENPVDILEGMNPVKLFIGDGYERVEMETLSKEVRIQLMRQQMMKYLEESQRRKNLKLTAKKTEGEEKEDAYKLKEDVIGLERRKKQIEEIIRELKGREVHYREEKFDENVEKVEKYKSFWSSTLSFEEKKGFLKVIIEDLGRHLKSLKNHLVVEVFQEALGHAKEDKTWKFLECCICFKKYGDPQLYRNHFELHFKNLKSIIQSISKEEIASEWIQMIENDVWKPVDTDMAINIIVNHMNSESVSTGDSGLCTEKGLGVRKAYVQGTICEEYNQKWPLCDDAERAESLERIHGTYLLLLRRRFLAPRHVHWAIQYTIHQLQAKISLSQLRFHGLQNPKVICFLGASELKEVLNFYENLAIAHGLSENSEMGISMDDSPMGHNIKVRVVFDVDFSYLHLDERILWGELNNANYFDAFAGDGSVETSAVDVCKDDVLPDSNEIVSLLYLCPKIAEYMNLWRRERDSIREKATEVLGVMFAECSYLLANYDRISKLSSKMEGLLAVDNICLEEIKNREQCPERVPQLYVNLLKKRQTDLQGNDDYASRTESDNISDVLKKATLALSSGQSDPKGCTIDHALKHTDNCIKLALQKLRMQLLTDVGVMAFVDTIILQRIDAFRKYELVLEKLSVYDYRLIFVPLLKSFLQARLHDLYDQDAMKKYDAQTESVLAKLALDAEANGTAKHHQLPQKDAEQEDNHNSEIGESADELKQLIAIDERLLEEKLEHQRQFEYEANLKVNVLGNGIGNEAADYFLSMIIKSLWHLREFREKFISSSQSIHKHIGKPCVVCALFDIFISIASADDQGEAVGPTTLRIALSTRLHDENIFQEGQMNDTSQFLQIILESIHESFNEVNPDFESENKYEGTLDCFLADCFVHRIFGMDHHESINCVNCYAESRHRKYTSLTLNVKAYNLRMKKNTHVGSPFDVLLKLAEMNGKLACKACGQINQIYHTLWCLPHVFTIILGWQRDDGSPEATSMTLSALCNKLDLSILFRGYPPDNIYFLVSVVCCSGDGQHYICFLMIIDMKSMFRMMEIMQRSLVPGTMSFPPAINCS